VNRIDADGKLKNMGAFWGIRSLLEGSRDEYRGWRQFRHAMGVWPLWSIGASVSSIPILFAVGTYAFIRVLETHRMPLVWTGLLVLGITLGLLWYGLRRLANHLDFMRAKKLHSRISPGAQRFIR
jgi:hypothetical protein